MVVLRVDYRWAVPINVCDSRRLMLDWTLATSYTEQYNRCTSYINGHWACRGLNLTPLDYKTATQSSQFLDLVVPKLQPCSDVLILVGEFLGERHGQIHTINDFFLYVFGFQSVDQWGLTKQFYSTNTHGMSKAGNTTRTFNWRRK